MLLFPAATTNTTPSVMPRATAALRAADEDPPRLMLATAGTPVWWSPIIQSIPAITPEVDPLPLHDMTRTGTSVTDFATPNVVPPTVPATCVPCPWQSVVPRPSEIEVNPAAIRPVNSLCVARMPVSTTYAVTPVPELAYEYVLFSGKLR